MLPSQVIEPATNSAKTQNRFCGPVILIAIVILIVKAHGTAHHINAGRRGLRNAYKATHDTPISRASSKMCKLTAQPP
jgi:hypothetical protein